MANKLQILFSFSENPSANILEQWNKWLLGHDDRCDIYVHVKQKDTFNWNGANMPINYLDQKFQTFANSNKSKSYLMLFYSAVLKQSKGAKSGRFFVITEECVPLLSKSFDDVYVEISAINAPIIATHDRKHFILNYSYAKKIAAMADIKTSTELTNLIAKYPEKSEDHLLELLKPSDADIATMDFIETNSANIATTSALFFCGKFNNNPFDAFDAEDVAVVAQEEPPVEDEDHVDEELTLKLGDIIILTANSEELNNKAFLIDYIDSSKIKLLSTSEPFITRVFYFVDGQIDSDDITGITIDSNATESGYARQHGLLPGTWITVNVRENDVSEIYTFKITNLEHDMIEVENLNDDEHKKYYIDFAYKGIPDDMNITSIYIRNAPLKVTMAEDIKPNAEIMSEADMAAADAGDVIVNFDDVNMDDVVMDVDFDESPPIEFIKHVELSESQYRYTLPIQTSDLLDQHIISARKQTLTPIIIQNINTIIARFIQLRDEYSTRDSYGNISGTTKFGADWKPIVHSFVNMKNPLHWLLFGVKSIKKIFYDDSLAEKRSKKDIGFQLEEGTTRSDARFISSYDMVTEIVERFNEFENGILTTDSHRYVDLYRGLNDILTPYMLSDSIAPGTLRRAEIGKTTQVIIDNLREKYGDQSVPFSSSAIGDNKLINTRFAMQRVIDGLNRLEYIGSDQSRFKVESVKLTPNNAVDIVSIVRMPEPFIEFSAINLPGTSIMSKLNKSQLYSSYWEYLQSGIKVTNITIDNLEKWIDYTAKNAANSAKTFTSGMHKFTIDLTNIPDNMTQAEIFAKFMQIITPSTYVFFEIIKPRLTGTLSFIEIVRLMEPFMIYSKHITFKQYSEFNRVLIEKIRNYNAEYAKNRKIFNTFKTTNITKRTDASLFNVFSESREIADLVSTTYNLRKNLHSNSEIIREVNLYDNGTFYNVCVAYANMSLMYATDLTADIASGASPKLDANATEDCGIPTIVKVYKTQAEFDVDSGMSESYIKIESPEIAPHSPSNIPNSSDEFIPNRSDTNSPQFNPDADYSAKIYHDIPYNQIYYDILARYPQVKQIVDNFSESSQKPADLRAELLEHMNDTNAVDQLIDAKFSPNYVKPGEYCLLTANNNKKYYVRTQSGTWEAVDDPKCATKQNCMETSENACISKKGESQMIKAKILKSMVDQFDKKYQITQDLMYKKIKSLTTYLHDSYLRKKKYYFDQLINSSLSNYLIGVEFEKHAEKIIQSPYKKLFDVVMGQSDFVKKQNDLVVFANRFTREPNTNMFDVQHADGVTKESEHWRYCRESSAKLMPKFIYQLAKTFIETPDKYIEVLHQITKTIGTISDDGDKWVDINSGYMIRVIDASADEGFDEAGYATVSHALVEPENVENSDANTIKIGLNVINLYKLVANTVDTFTEYLYMRELNEHREYIIRTVIKLINENPPLNEEQYNEEIRNMEKKNTESKKKIMVYENYVEDFLDKSVLFFTMGAILVSVQTNPVPLTSRTAYPNCHKSFDGFPIDNTGNNLDGLKYVTCVAYKLRRKELRPWKVLANVRIKDAKNGDVEKINAIVANIYKFLKGFFITNAEIAFKLEQRREYDRSIPADVKMKAAMLKHVPTYKWSNFMPPLQKFTLTKIDPLPTDYFDILKGKLTANSRDALTYLQIAKSKTMFYGMAIQEYIQNIVSEQDLIFYNNLHNNPYTENSCCNETANENVTTLEYFISKAPEIRKINIFVRAQSVRIKDTLRLFCPPMLSYYGNFKPAVTKPLPIFHEETIYRAFIKYCNFDNIFPIKPEYKLVSGEKPDVSILFNSNISDVIKKIKNAGKTYTPALMDALLTAVGKNCTANVDLNITAQSDVTKMKNLLRSQTDTRSEFKDNLTKLFADPHPDQQQEFRGFMYTKIAQMQTIIVEFLKDNLSQNEVKPLVSFLSKPVTGTTIMSSTAKVPSISYISSWKLSEPARILNFMRNWIHNLAKVYPTMVKNGIMYGTKNSYDKEPPKYWNLSQNHYDTIVSKSIIPSTQFLTELQNNKTLGSILDKIMTGCDIWCKFSDITRTNNVIESKTSLLLCEYYIFNILGVYMGSIQKNTNKSSGFGSQITNLQSSEVAKMIKVFIGEMISNKSDIDYTIDNISDRIFAIRDKEKTQMVDYMNDLNQEERELEVALKSVKLGRWGIGIKNGVRKYDAKAYDAALEFGETMDQIDSGGYGTIDTAEKVEEIVRDFNMTDEDRAENAANVAEEREKYGISGYNHDGGDRDDTEVDEFDWPDE